MKRPIILLLMTAIAGWMLSGCAEDNYNAGYIGTNSYESYDHRMDRAAQDAMKDAAGQLSAQDIKNLNSLK